MGNHNMSILVGKRQAHPLFPYMHCLHCVSWMISKKTCNNLFYPVSLSSVRLTRRLANIFEIWWENGGHAMWDQCWPQVACIHIKTGDKYIYGKLKKTIYNTLLGVILFYQKLATQLHKWSYIMTPYGACTLNKTVNGKHATIQYFIDTLHIPTKVWTVWKN